MKRHDKFVLFALAPWPTLLSLVRRAPQEWMVWGKLPRTVWARFEMMGIEVRSEQLPQPLHHAELPDWLWAPHRGIVVPALGHPLPTRWPILRRLIQTGTPVYAARHGQMTPVLKIPHTDAFTWALDRGEERVTTALKASARFACVRADLLGDLLLAVPALAALAAAGSIRLIVRREWREWMTQLLPPACEVQGIQLAPWTLPSFEPVETAIDMSPPGWRSVLTPAIARSVPAKTHLRLTRGDGLSEMLALALGLEVHWPCRTKVCDSYGVLVPTGSSPERLLPENYWIYAVQRLSRVMDVRRWKILDPEQQLSPGILKQIPDTELLVGRQEPEMLINLVRSAAIVAGVSTALTHLAALTGTPALVVEHPTTVPGMYRAPVPFVRYIRPSKPWWCDDPSDADVDRAMVEMENTYGFVEGEWHDAIEQAVAHPPFAES